MANESNLNIQEDKLTKLLDVDWIKNQEISNFEEFSDYSEEELNKMRKDVAFNDDMDDWEKYWVRRNIENIIEAKNKEKKAREAKISEEEDKKKTEELKKERLEAQEQQDRKAEELKKGLLDNVEETQEETQEDTQEETQEEAQEDIQEEALNNRTIDKSQNEKEDNNNYQEQIDSLNKSNEELRRRLDEQSKQIEDLLAAKKENNSEEINKIKKEIEEKRKEIESIKQERDNLLRDNRKMKDLYFWELPKYNGNIIPLETNMVEFKFGVNAIEWNQRVLSMPQLRLRKNIISRHRLNATIRKLNEIWNNPKEWVNYILTKADFFKWGAKIWTLCKKIWNYFKIRDIDSFDRIFNEQKKIFIDDIEAKMQGRLSENDKRTMRAIRDRLDYYQKAYKRQFLTV